MTVLGCLRILHRRRELHQHRLLVPLLLCLQVHLPPVALSAHVPVSFLASYRHRFELGELIECQWCRPHLPLRHGSRLRPLLREGLHCLWSPYPGLWLRQVRVSSFKWSEQAARSLKGVELASCQPTGPAWHMFDLGATTPYHDERMEISGGASARVGPYLCNVQRIATLCSRMME